MTIQRMTTELCLEELERRIQEAVPQGMVFSKKKNGDNKHWRLVFKEGAIQIDVSICLEQDHIIIKGNPSGRGPNTMSMAYRVYELLQEIVNSS